MEGLLSTGPTPSSFLLAMKSSENNNKYISNWYFFWYQIRGNQPMTPHFTSNQAYLFIINNKYYSIWKANCKLTLSFPELHQFVLLWKRRPLPSCSGGWLPGSGPGEVLYFSQHELVVFYDKFTFCVYIHVGYVVLKVWFVRLGHGFSWCSRYQ